MSATDFVTTDAFRKDLETVFAKADVEAQTGVSFDEVSEWLIDDAEDFLTPDEGEKLTEQDIRDFIEETMDSMAATAMPDLLKAKGKPAADAAKVCIDGLHGPVTDVFLKHFKG